MMMVIAATFFLALSADAAAVREIFTLGEATQVIDWIAPDTVVVSFLGKL